MEKILYIGSSDDYTKKFEEEVNRVLLGVLLIVIEPDLYDAFNMIRKNKIRLVILDHGAQDVFNRRVTVMMKKAFEDLSIVVLVPDQESVNEWNILSRGDYAYWIKGQGPSELLEYFTRKLGVPSKQNLTSRKAHYDELIDIEQCMRISYFSRFHAQLETSLDFNNECVVNLNLPLWGAVFRSDRHRLSKKLVGGSESHFRYTYKLDYMLNTLRMDSDTRSKTLKDLRYEVKSKKINEVDTREILEASKEKRLLLVAQDEPEMSTLGDEDTKSEKEIVDLMKALYLNWILSKGEPESKKQDVLTIYDRHLHVLKNGLAEIELESVRVVHRTDIVNHQVNMVADQPSIIFIYADEENNFTRIKEMITSITLLKDKFPYIIIFNYQVANLEMLRHDLEYHFVLATGTKPDPVLVVKTLDLYRKKRLEKELGRSRKKLAELREKHPSFVEYKDTLFLDHRYYLGLDDPKSLVPYALRAEFTWISEREISFRTREHLQRGDIFSMTSPVKAQLEILEVVDYPKEGYRGYTAYLHGLTDVNRQVLAAFVNEIALLNDRKTPISQEDLKKIKGRHFKTPEMA